MHRKRGRKSAASVVATSLVPAAPIPEPSYSILSDEAAEIWRTTLAALPANWIASEAFPILEAYCNHIAAARLLEREISRFNFDWFKEDGGPERYDRLAKMRERENRAALACARALRLTPQSRMRSETAATKRNARPAGMKPIWDF